MTRVLSKTVELFSKTVYPAPIFRSAALAQLVEHRIRNAGVRCSSHLSSTSFTHQIKPCKSGALAAIFGLAKGSALSLGSYFDFSLK